MLILSHFPAPGATKTLHFVKVGRLFEILTEYRTLPYHSRFQTLEKKVAPTGVGSAAAREPSCLLLRLILHSTSEQTFSAHFR
jgi:hypothetical protein